MKKIVSILCSIFFFLTSSVSAQELKVLYSVQNVPQENLSNIIENFVEQSGFKILSKNDFYFIPVNASNSSSDYYEILISQTNDGYNMLYVSSSGNLNLANSLEKEIKKGHYKIKKLDVSTVAGMFDSKENILKNRVNCALESSKKYDFSDTAQQVYDQIDGAGGEPNIVPVSNYQPQYSVEKAEKTVLKSAPIKKTQGISHSTIDSYVPVNQNVLKGAIVTVASGTTFGVTLQSAVSSASLSMDDKITAVLDDDFKYNGYVIFPTGTVLYGEASKATAASYGYANGSLDLNFYQALLPSGQKVRLAVNKISYAQKSERAANITRDVAIGTGVGALGGLLTAIYTGDIAQALIVGASIGAAGGGLHAVSQKGNDIEIPEGTKFNLQLSQPINISPYK